MEQMKRTNTLDVTTEDISMLLAKHWEDICEAMEEAYQVHQDDYMDSDKPPKFSYKVGFALSLAPAPGGAISIQTDMTWSVKHKKKSGGQLVDGNQLKIDFTPAEVKGPAQQAAEKVEDDNLDYDPDFELVDPTDVCAGCLSLVDGVCQELDCPKQPPGSEQPTAPEPEAESNTATDLSALALKAIVIIKETQRASTSALQRRLKIGYTKASAVMDELEAAGKIGPANGSEPREVFV